MPELTLTLLGSFQAQLDDKPVIGFQSDKARALLIYLVIESHSPQRRDKLAGLLWPDFLDSTARSNLRHALANLRSILGDKQNPQPILLADRQTIEVNPDANINTDANSFSQIAGQVTSDAKPEEAIAAIQQAIPIYQGPFLDGFFLPDCADFEEWLTLTRERLHLEHNQLLQTLIEHFSNGNDLEEALVYARIKLQHNQLIEEEHLRVMRLLGLLGQRGKALQQYESCVHILRNEFDIEPSEHAKALHHAIQCGKLAPLPILKPSQAILSNKDTIQTAKSEDNRKPRHNLPNPLTSFVGRSESMADIEELLQQEHIRLLTIEGPGGIGKTRLAIELGRRLNQHFVDGIFWVELAALSSSEQVVPAIAEVLGIKEPHLHSLEEEVARTIDAKRVLLILDNFEHVIDAALMVSELLVRASAAKILCTSRMPLNLYGEITYPLSTLTFPSSNNRTGANELRGYPALQLLIDRGRAVIPKLELSDAELGIAGRVCERLDGLPLAIELMASRLKQLTLGQIHDEFINTDATGLINTRSKERNRPHRHQSLYNAVDWSYQLLNLTEQIVLRRLAIFWGGCTYQAAALVCLPEQTEDIDSVIEILAEYNLIRIERPESGTKRIFMLETIRDFGVEQLRKHGEYDHLSQLHSEYYIQWVEGLYADDESPGAGSPGLNSPQVISAEFNNIHAVQRWTLGNTRTDSALRLAAKLRGFWTFRTDSYKDIHWIDQVLEKHVANPLTIEYAEALFSAGFGAMQQGKSRKAKQLFTESLSVSQAISADDIAGYASGLLGNICFEVGDYDASKDYFKLSYEIREKLGAAWETGMLLFSMGTHAMELSDLEDAEQRMKSAMHCMQKLNNTYGLCLTYAYLGKIKTEQGQYDVARNYFTQYLDQYGDSNPDAGFLQRFAWLEIAEENYEKAENLLTTALGRFAGTKAWKYVYQCLEDLVILRTRQDHFGKAVLLAAFTDKIREREGTVRPPLSQAYFDKAVEEATRSLSQLELTYATRDGKTIELEALLNSLDVDVG